MAKIINISGVIGWETTAQGVREALNAANGDEVVVHVSSPGGYISEGLEIFNLLRDYQGPISGVLKGYAMSMGSYIPLAIPLNRTNPGKLAAEDNAIYMIHNARGGVWGDHQEILKYGDALKGMSNMIAKAYSRRTGKDLADVQAMMDAETFLFGDDIKAHGFVDEIIDATDETDEESATAQARAMFDTMVAKMSADQARMRSDLDKVALMLAAAPAATTVSTPAPAAAGNITQEVQQTMSKTLATLLAENPTAQAEYTQALANARKDGEQAVEARVTAAAPFIDNPAYGKAVTALALKVAKGEEAQSSLTVAVTVLDAQKEQGAAAPAAAAAAAAPAAPAAPVDLGTDASGVVKDDAGLTALVADMKGGM